MLMFFWILVVLVPIGLVAEQPHHTTAFIAESGSIDTLWSASAYSTRSFWNKNGKKLPTYNRFDQQSFMLYAEYSVDGCNSFWVDGGYTQVQEALNGNSRGIEDIQLGWKHIVKTFDDSVLTVQLVGIIPAGNQKSSIRYGRAGVELSMLYTQIFWLQSYCGWCDLDLGYRGYQGFPSDQLRAHAALGVAINPCLWLIATGQLEYGLFTGNAKGNINNVIFNANYRLASGKIECVYNLLSHVSLSLGAYAHFWGQNIGAGGGYYCGAWLDF